ncbi:hypothetical protein NB311A_18321 [Nitrobacter sp. Nb-311A]|nr:hypothetical protein NB311A_18321 [Nitrobacter sp. Nb-311A]
MQCNDGTGCGHRSTTDPKDRTAGKWKPIFERDDFQSKK